uniref:PDZ domain-containing protein n=1 Tax=Lactuca sativa TaxID=4236 RepID=A0A9R1UV76_LACSA|nr:hypothetical protein LSAT_V11C800390060 [Lactuca sativa]
MSTTTAIGAGGAFATRNALSIKTTTSYPLASPHQKTTFQGLSIQDAKRGVSTSFLGSSDKTIVSVKGGRGLDIKARKTAGASKEIEVEVDKPLGLTLGPKPGAGGGVVITGVEGGGNAAKAGLKAGDQVIYTSSFFGDELWPADKLGFTKTAIQAVPDSVYFVPDGYLCPQCRAPKKRFTGYDPVTGKPIGGTLPPIGVIIGLVAGLAGVGALLVYGLQ